MVATEEELSTLSFEDIVSRLTTLVDELEQGEAPLEQALSTFEQGVSLARAGARRLDEAERRIELLLDDDDEDGRPRTRALHDPSDTEAD